MGLRRVNRYKKRSKTPKTAAAGVAAEVASGAFRAISTIETLEEQENNNSSKNIKLSLTKSLETPPNGSSSVSKIMAPALTEPLRTANQLTSSSSPDAASVSPQLVNLDIQEGETTTNINSGVSDGSFQLAFEDSFSKTSRKIRKAPSNGSLIEFQMGPMSNTTSNIKNNKDNNSNSANTNTIASDLAVDNYPITFISSEKDFEEAITAEICLRRGGGAVSPGDLSEEHLKIQQRNSELMDFLQKQKNEPQLEELSDKKIDEEQSNKEEEDKLNSPSRAKIDTASSCGSVAPRISTDSTVTASEGDHVDETFSQLDSSVKLNTNISSIPTSANQLPANHQAYASNTSSANMGLPRVVDMNAAEIELGDIDLLNVLTNLESSAGGENLCDLAGLFNDDDMNYEEEIAPSVIQSSISTKIPPSVVSVISSNTSPLKDGETKEIQCDIKKMQRQIDFLLRRLRKLQSRNVCKQASEEISGLFEWSNRIVRRKDYEPTRRAEYEDEKQRAVSATSMRTVLKKIDSISTQQRSTPSKKSKIGRPSNVPGPAVSIGKHPPLSTLVPQFDSRTAEEMSMVAGSLKTELREIEHGMDSDATISSSGGESADETVTYNNPTQQSVTISRRAAWRYSRDRAAIAARWTWLLSQISDLEYKKRQHEELYNQIKKAKGAVQLEEVRSCVITSQTAVEVKSDLINDENSSSCRTRPFDRNAFRKRKLLQTANIHTVSKKAARPSSVKCGCQWPMHPCALCTGRPDPTAPRDLPDTMLLQERASLLDNGFHPVLSFPEDKSYSLHIESTCNSYDWRTRCLRCTAKSAIKSVIAAQKAAIRSDNSAKKLSNESKRKYKKRNTAATTTQSIDFYSDEGGGGGSGSSTPYPANKVPRNSKKYQNLHLNHQRINNNSDGYSQQNQIHSSSIFHQNLNSTTPMLSSAVKNNKIRKVSSSTSFLNNNGNIYGSSGSVGGGIDSFDGFNDGNLNNLNGLRSSRNSSPTHNYYNNSSYYKNERTSERKNRNSYDIDNIVIPYSVAASTRVELLQYKEIPTPKWRIIEDDDFLLNDANVVDDNDIMDFDKTSIDKLFEEFVSSASSCSKLTGDITSIVGDENSTSNLQETPSSPSKLQKLQKEPSPDNSSTEIYEIPITMSPSSLHETDDPKSKSPTLTTAELEDISDEAILSRHERGFNEERKKFATYLKFPWSTRSRANRRADSRTESSGTNTPDPSSPAPPAIADGIGPEADSIPSPATSTHPSASFDLDAANESTSIFAVGAAPLSGNSGNSNSISRRNERKRTVSTKRDRDRSSTPDIREQIPPFEPLQFPIPNEVYEEMLKLMPSDHQTIEDCFNILPPITNNKPIDDKTCDERLQHLELPDNSSELATRTRQAIVDKNSSSTVVPDLSGSAAVAADNAGCQNSMGGGNDLLGGNFFDDFSTFNENANYSPALNHHSLLDDSETESVETNLQDEDPNDPEWKADPA